MHLAPVSGTVARESMARYKLVFSVTGTTKQSPEESGGLILVYVY
jgi:hypothetical protein